MRHSLVFSIRLYSTHYILDNKIKEPIRVGRVRNDPSRNIPYNRESSDECISISMDKHMFIVNLLALDSSAITMTKCMFIFARLIDTHKLAPYM